MGYMKHRQDMMEDLASEFYLMPVRLPIDSNLHLPLLVLIYVYSMMTTAIGSVI